MEQDT